MPKKLNVKQKNVLRELSKNGRASDKEIAKRLGYSQPTVTRIRGKLESGGYILKYCSLPNLNKVGYELIAIISFASSKESDSLTKRGISWTSKNKNVIFASMGEGFDGRTRVMITVHKNYTDYEKFIRDFRKKWPDSSTTLTSFIAPLSLLVKQMTFEDLF